MRLPFRRLAPVAATMVALLAGCAAVGNVDSTALMGAGGNAYKALSLSDGEIATMSDESCAAMDKKNTIADAKSPYAVRLAKAVQSMPATINGKPAEYKVYMTEEVNAWAMANGCIRVYSGLMDLMNDDELRGVLGHEIGHVALGHSKSRMQTAYATSAARALVSASGIAGVKALTDSQAGDVAEKFVQAQFSQAQESAADDYSFNLLTERKLEPKGLVTGFQKLASLDGGSQGGSLLSSHPPSQERAARMQKRLDDRR